MSLKLRPYQQAAIDAVKERHQDGDPSVLISLPTGTGKTVIFTTLIAEQLRSRPGSRALVLAHREELVYQAEAKMRTIAPDLSTGIVRGTTHQPYARAVFGSVASFNQRRRDRLDRWPVDLLVIDEAHHAQPRNTYGQVVDWLRATNPDLRVLGVTATPYRGDRRGLGGVFPVCAYSYDLRSAIEDGYLTPLRGVQVRTTTDLSGVQQRGGDLDPASLSAILNTANRNALIVDSWREHCGGQAVAFCADVAHARQLAAAFCEAGVPAAAVWGAMGREDRASALARFARPDADDGLTVITNCGVLTEGWDYPPLRAVLLARPTQSQVLYAQAVGRATRLAPGKAEAVVVDFADVCSRLSLVGLADLTRSDRDPSSRDPVERGAAGDEPEAQTFLIQPVGAGLRAFEVSLLGHEGDDEPPVDVPGWALIRGDYVADADRVKAILVRGTRPDTRHLWRAYVYRDYKGATYCNRIQGEQLGSVARRAAEILTRYGSRHLSRADAPWKQQPASKGQLSALRRWRFGDAALEGLTRGEASALLTRSILRAKIREGRCAPFPGTDGVEYV